VQGGYLVMYSITQEIPMHRSTLSLFAVAALLAGCASNSHNPDTTIQPGQSSPSRADGERGGPGGRGRGGAGRLDEMLLRGITLSSDQQQRIDSIRTRYRSQMDQARQQGGSVDRDQMRTTMERQQSEIRAVLTADQQRVFDQNVADMRSRAQQGGGRAGGAPPR
jgi:Spy/CpxP family protein refolding chaperone